MEIQQIEQSIINTEGEIGAFRNQQGSLSERCEAFVHQDSIQIQFSDNRRVAERNWNKLKSIEGISSWRVKNLEESTISIEVKDRNISELSVLIDFKEVPSGKSGNIICKTRVMKRNIDATKRKKGNFSSVHSNYSLNVMTYIDHCTDKICQELNRHILHSSSDMFNVVNHVEWNLGRLALIGKELTMLERRHKGILKKSGRSETSAYVLDVTINGQRDQTIGASFYICESYPFAVLDVDLSLHGDTHINIDSLERQLIKSSRPGFGYLSRSCDIIACFDS